MSTTFDIEWLGGTCPTVAVGHVELVEGAGRIGFHLRGRHEFWYVRFGPLDDDDYVPEDGLIFAVSCLHEGAGSMSHDEVKSALSQAVDVFAAAMAHDRTLVDPNQDRGRFPWQARSIDISAHCRHGTHAIQPVTVRRRGRPGVLHFRRKHARVWLP